VASLLSVNVGRPRLVDTGRRTVSTAIWKRPVDGRVAARGVNLAGDDQADRSVHGGPDKAVYAYASEEIAAWEAELNRDLGPAPFGENLTVSMRMVFDAVLLDERLIPQVLEAPALLPSLRTWLTSRLETTEGVR